MNRGLLGNSFNENLQSGYYKISDLNKQKEGNPGISYGVLLVFITETNYTIQIVSSVQGGTTYLRCGYDLHNTTWQKLI